MTSQKVYLDDCAFFLAQQFHKLEKAQVLKNKCFSFLDHTCLEVLS